MLEEVTFRQAIWLFCPAFALHVLEEWPRFTGWAQRHASKRFTQHEYNAIHIAGISASAVSTALVWRFPSPILVFLFFAFAFAPAIFLNTVFHAGASLLTRTYCPGVLTAVAIYLPLFALISMLAYREGSLSIGSFVAALLVAGVFHTWEVGHNVFKAW